MKNNRPPRGSTSRGFVNLTLVLAEPSTLAYAEPSDPGIVKLQNWDCYCTETIYTKRDCHLTKTRCSRKSDCSNSSVQKKAFARLCVQNLNEHV